VPSYVLYCGTLLARARSMLVIGRTATPCASFALLALLALPLELARRSATVATSTDAACTEALAGTIRFDSASRRFQGCDGVGWSLLAFCCAPERPAPPRLSVSADCDLWLGWKPPRAHGSPVTSYSLVAATAPSSHAVAAPRVVYRGAQLGCCVADLGARLNGVWFTVTAHAVGGDSEPSEPVQLQRAPAPVAFEAEDEGTCDLGTGDVLRVFFDQPTNRAGEGQHGERSVLGPETVERLLSFSSSVGALTGRWRSAEVLELRVAPGAPPSQHGDPLLQHLVVNVRPEGGVSVAPPALSLPASGGSPPLRVPSCFLEGFEAAQLGTAWVIESTDLSAYSVSLDEHVHRSGRHALRLEGGRSASFDGLRAQLPPNARPRHVAFWVRASAIGNLGYLSLGGGSLQSSALFFHLRADGSAGLLSATGGWTHGAYRPLRWVHVQIDIEWPYRSVDLRLDGTLVASDVGFASSDVQHADEIHLFNFDEGTAWFDDIVIRL
jgi:hypothetical protein